MSVLQPSTSRASSSLRDTPKEINFGSGSNQAAAEKTRVTNMRTIPSLDRHSAFSNTMRNPHQHNTHLVREGRQDQQTGPDQHQHPGHSPHHSQAVQEHEYSQQEAHSYQSSKPQTYGLPQCQQGPRPFKPCGPTSMQTSRNNSMTSISYPQLDTRSITQPRRSSVDNPRSLRTSGEPHSHISNDPKPWGRADHRETFNHTQSNDLRSASYGSHLPRSYDDHDRASPLPIAPGSRMDTSPDHQTSYTQWSASSPETIYHNRSKDHHAMMDRSSGPQMSLDDRHDSEWASWQRPRTHYKHQHMEQSSPSEPYSRHGNPQGYREERHTQDITNECKLMWESTKPQSRGASKTQEKWDLGRQQGQNHYYDQFQHTQPHQEHHQHQHQHQQHHQRHPSQEQQYNRWQSKPLTIVSEIGELPSPTLESSPAPFSSSETKGGRLLTSMPVSHAPMTSSNGPLAHPVHERASTVGPKHHQQNGLSFASRVIARPRTSTVDVPFGMRIRDRDGVFSFGDQSTGSAPRWPTDLPAVTPVVRTDMAAFAAQSMITPSPTERSLQGRESSLLSAASPSTSPSLNSPLDGIVRSASVQSDSASTAGMDSRKSSLSSLLKAGADGQFVLGREGYYGANELKALFSQWKTELKEETAPSTSSSAFEKTSDRGKARAVSAGESSKSLAGTSQGRFKNGQLKRTRTEAVGVSKLERTQGEVEQSTEDDEDEDEDEDGYGDEDEDEDEDYGMGGVHRGSAKRRASSSSSSSSMADRKRMKVSESSLVVSRGKRGKDKAVVKNHKCDHCEKRFSRPSQLKQHIYKHTGEKPFACEICLRHFSVSSNLKRHIRTHATNLHRQNVNRTGDNDFNPLIIDTVASSSSSSSSASSSAFNPSRKVILHMYLPEGTSESSTRLVLEGFAAAVQQPSLPASFGGAVVEVHPRSSVSLQNNNNSSSDSNKNNSSSSSSSTSVTNNANNNNNNNYGSIDSIKKDDSSNNVVDPSSPLLPPKNEDADEGQA